MIWQPQEAASTVALRRAGSDVRDVVASVIGDVRNPGDAAVRQCSETFDSRSPESRRLGPETTAAPSAETRRPTPARGTAR